MELFRKAITVKLSHKDKYLVAEEDQESVSLDRDGTLKNAVWAVEFANRENYLRFKSYYGKYLTVSNEPFNRPGSAGRKVFQTLPKKPGPTTEWEPLRDGFSARFKTPFGTFLRPNGGLPPWRNSVTHEIPNRTGTQEKILWDVEVVWAIPRTPPPPLPPPSPSRLRCEEEEESAADMEIPIGRKPPILEPPKIRKGKH